MPERLRSEPTLTTRILGRVRRDARRADPRHWVLGSESRAFDRRWDTDTASVSSLDDLSIVGGRRESGFFYVPTGPRLFGAFRGALPEDLGAHTFVDLGSGKGRTLLLAAEAGFGRAVGVEFAAELHAAAEDTVERYRSAGGAAPTRLECVHADAGSWAFPAGPLVVYLQNPFAEDVMERVLANLARTLADDPREIWLCYLQLEKEDPGDATRNVELISASGLFESRPVPRGSAADRLVLSPFDLRVFVTPRSA